MSPCSRGINIYLYERMKFIAIKTADGSLTGNLWYNVMGAEWLVPYSPLFDGIIVCGRPAFIIFDIRSMEEP